jgi:hypothetical protein
MKLSAIQLSRRGVVLAGLSTASVLAIGLAQRAEVISAAVPANTRSIHHYTRENISTYIMAL